MRPKYNVWYKLHSPCLEEEEDEYNPKNNIPTVKHGGGNIMLWGCFSAKGNRPIHCVLRGGWMYRKIFGQQHPSLSKSMKMSCGWVFQHDNDPKHTTRTTKEWLRKKHFKVLEWLASLQTEPKKIYGGSLNSVLPQRQPQTLKDLEKTCMEECAKNPCCSVYKPGQELQEHLTSVIVNKVLYQILSSIFLLYQILISCNKMEVHYLKLFSLFFFRFCLSQLRCTYDENDRSLHSL